MELEGFMTCSVQEMEHKLNAFLDTNLKMPEWSVFFNQDFRSDFICGEAFNIRISQLTFGQDNGKFVIGRYIRDKVTSYIISSEDFRQSEVFYSTNIDGFNIRDISVPLNQCFRYRTIYCRSIVLHASAAVYNGKAILFTGISGAGKSTQARLWGETVGAEILNYDQALVFLQDNDIKVCATPWAGKENIYKTGIYPSQAIVLVEKSDNNSVREIAKGEAFSRIYLNNYLYPITQEIEDRYCDLITNLVSGIPVYSLKCTASKEAVNCLCSRIYDWAI